MAAIPDEQVYLDRITAGSGAVSGDMPVVCGHFDDLIVWKISKDIIGMWVGEERGGGGKLTKCIALDLSPLN
jgi:hypothetical protein